MKSNQEIHDEMLVKLKDLVEHLNKNGFGYWITIGREGTSANYCGGKKGDVLGAATHLLERNTEIASLLQKALIESLG
jgi:hypothetical protein